MRGIRGNFLNGLIKNFPWCCGRCWIVRLCLVLRFISFCYVNRKGVSCNSMSAWKTKRKLRGGEKIQTVQWVEMWVGLMIKSWHAENTTEWKKYLKPVCRLQCLQSFEVYMTILEPANWFKEFSSFCSIFIRRYDNTILSLTSGPNSQKMLCLVSRNLRLTLTFLCFFH